MKTLFKKLMLLFKFCFYENYFGKKIQGFFLRAS